MEIDSVTQVAFISASILSLILTGIFLSQLYRKTLHWSLAAASAMRVSGDAALPDSARCTVRTLSAATSAS